MERNYLIVDTTVAWANSDAANTTKNVDLTYVGTAEDDGKYVVTIRNPSSETALTVKFTNKETFAAVDYYPEVTTSVSVAAGATKHAVVDAGWFLGSGGRLIITNDTLIGVAGAFTAYVRVRKA